MEVSGKTVCGTFLTQKKMAEIHWFLNLPNTVRFKLLKHCKQLSVKFQFFVENTNTKFQTMLTGCHAHKNADLTEVLVEDLNTVKIEANM